MEILSSKINPRISPNRDFTSVFDELLISSDHVKIATGYVSEESLMRIKSILDFHKDQSTKKSCDLIIGMHHRDGFTRSQYQAAKNLSEFLNENDLGDVRLCTAFKFHGKVYSFFKKESHFASIMGSSNLSDIIGAPQCEVNCVFNDDISLKDFDSLHQSLVEKATKRLLDLDQPEFIENHSLLQDRIGVEKANPGELIKTGLSFKIPLKAELKSNLNVYFGKGRLSKNGAIRPRAWYEVEVIVSKEITSQPGYPINTSFNVITDDGWKFECTTGKKNGKTSKNLRSDDDLQTLGRWIKGRLEVSGVLTVGALVTSEMLDRYGRDFITLYQTTDPNTWILDFSTTK